MVLKVRADCDRSRWDEDEYELFIDTLCGEREYQKEAIRVCLRYLLGGEYQNLETLAKENWEKNPSLDELHGSWTNFSRHLQLPDRLSASVDLATGTGKSFVIYGVAAILLAKGAVDRVLVLCPSTTIESGLYAKFKLLAGSSDLEAVMPPSAVRRIPQVIHATETIVSGCICVENRDAVYAHVKSSIQDSLAGKNVKVAVLNDEAHHVANEPAGKVTRWKEFLLKPEYNFPYVMGFSGTCYVGNNYFSDVIYRYSLRKAIEEGYVKKIKYLTELQHTGEEDEEWQLRLSLHEQKRQELKSRNLTPLSIITTYSIQSCKSVGAELKEYLQEQLNYDEEEADEKVLIVYSNAPDVAKLSSVDAPDSSVEWVVSVSMLTEGWDVSRVFQIVPHELRAFESRLLISQVLGRGLRIPPGWKGAQPEVTVFNHSAWASSIRYLVNEILENERVLTAIVLPDSPHHFKLYNLDYNVIQRSEERIKQGAFDLLSEGYVRIPTETASVAVEAEFTNAVTDNTEKWSATIRRKTYQPEEVASQMHHALEKLDMENNALSDPAEHTQYAKDFPFERLLEIVRRSLGSVTTCTESNKQKLLQALGTLRRKRSKIVRYELNPQQLVELSTKDKPDESASASQLRRDKTAFILENTGDFLPEEQIEFFQELREDTGDYKCWPIKNRYDLKSPVSMVFGDHKNERRFIIDLLKAENNKHLTAWIKSTSMQFYGIDYAWKKGEHPKRGKFNPDFFIKIEARIVVIEIKDDTELDNPSPENVKKNEYAVQHFVKLNTELEQKGLPDRYSFHFLAPKDFPDFFNQLRSGALETYRSHLDVKLTEAL